MHFGNPPPPANLPGTPPACVSPHPPFPDPGAQGERHDSRKPERRERREHAYFEEVANFAGELEAVRLRDGERQGREHSRDAREETRRPEIVRRDRRVVGGARGARGFVLGEWLRRRADGRAVGADTVAEPYSRFRKSMRFWLRFLLRW